MTTSPIIPGGTTHDFISGGPSTLDDINYANGLSPEFLNDVNNEPKNVYTTSHLQRQFTSSKAYNQAKALFESGPYSDVWLAKLEQLVQSLRMPDPNTMSVIADAFANTFSNRFTEMLNNAFVSLNNLINEWFQWFNSLPQEQRTQFEQAGLNIALDGGSMLSGSQTSPQGITSSPDFQGQQNQAFDNAVNFVTSTAGGLLNLVGLVNQVFSLRQQKRSLDITENSTLSSVNLQRLALGLTPLSSLPDALSSKVQDADVMSSFGIKSSNEAEAGSKKSRIALETDVNPLYNAVHDATFLGIGPYNEVMAELGNIKLGQLIYQQLYDKEKLAYDTKQLDIQSQIQGEFGVDLAVGEAQTALAEQAAKKVEFRTSSKLNEFGEQLFEYKKSVLSDWIEKANSDSADAFIYSSMLMKSGLQMSDFMGPADAWLNYAERGSGILDDILGVFSPAKWLRPKKIFKNYNTETKTTIYK